MKEIIELALSPWILPLTILLAVSGVYWLLAVLGTLDMDFLNIDLDTDIDADGNVSSDGFLASSLKLVNGADVPFMLVISMLKLMMWVFSVIYHGYVEFASYWWGGVLGLLASFILACVVTRYVMVPLRPLFASIKRGEDDEEPVFGVESTVVSEELTVKYGRVEVPRYKGAPAILTCKLAEGSVTLEKGSKVILFSREEESGLYLAKKI